MPSTGADWTDTHTLEHFRAMTRILLASRTQLYALPALSDVNGHGGDKINKKTQQALKVLAKGLGIEDGGAIVKEEMEGLKGRGGRGTSGTPAPSPKKVKGVKRKIKDENESEES